MKIILTTAIDVYRDKSPFPKNLTFVPRIGEEICVTQDFKSYYNKLKLPFTLEVKRITYYENHIEVSLHYSQQQVEMAKVCCVNLYP